MGYNLDAMENLLSWAELGGDEDNEFYMAEWAARPVPHVSAEECGTTLCMAGKTVSDAGHQIVWGGRVNLRGMETARSVRLVTSDSRNGDIRPIKETARTILGLTYSEAEALFVPDMSDIREDNRFAVEFLRYLVERAQTGSANMSSMAVDEWVEKWSAEEG